MLRSNGPVMKSRKWVLW